MTHLIYAIFPITVGNWLYKKLKMLKILHGNNEENIKAYHSQK